MEISAILRKQVEGFESGATLRRRNRTQVGRQYCLYLRAFSNVWPWRELVE
jgi:hypothetical protein